MGQIPPRVKDPNFILGLTYVSSNESSRKCRKACKACDKTRWKFITQINTRDLVKLNKYWRVVQWVESLGETPMIGFSQGIAGVRESVKTRVMGMRSLISCMPHNIPYRIVLFIWNVIGRFHVCRCMCILGG